ncbi:MAG: PKD domain-containing protein [Odoribacter sp.]|nr:PKD domain-containing protein [Odoribacter sp.]
MYRFLLRACFWGAFLFMSLADVMGQSYTTKTEKIKLDKDTVWIINAAYNLYKQELRLTLDFSEQTPKPTRICWDAKKSLPYENVGTQTMMSHTYSAGRYEVLLEVSGKTYHCMVFNQMLWADFKVNPDPFRYCIEAGGDSLLITMTNFEDNPPGTVYDVVVDGPETIDTVPLCSSNVNWFGPKLDSAWVVFSHPTGVKPCNVYLSLKYTDPEKGIDLEEETNVQRISVYGAPDVKKIFGFNPEDKFEPESNMVYMEVCTETNQDYLNLSEEILQYFQLKLHTPQAVPYYASYKQRQDLEIHYYYSDTIYPGMSDDIGPNGAWKEVTGQESMVSVEQPIAFMTPGYYKMMITAKNLCNEVGGVKIDTLWTDFVEDGSDKRRYFKVYSGSSAKMVCTTPRYCLNAPKAKIRIVDYNVRRGYDAPPSYLFSYRFLQPSPYVNYRWAENDWVITEEIWRGGKIVPKNAARDCGCDSTVIYLELKNIALYGELEIEVERRGFCGSSQNTFMVEVGRNPKIDEMEILRELRQKYGFAATDNVLGAQPHCDTVRYVLPIDSLSKGENTRGFALDSVCWYIRKGLASEETLVYRLGDQTVPVEWLDSLDVITTSRMVSYNVCGPSVLKNFNLFIATRPKVELLRDAVSENDSLCVGLEYPYNWKGTFPKDYTIQLTSTEEVFVNGEKKEGGKAIEVNNGDGFRYESVKQVNEHFVIQNTQMKTCQLDSVWVLETLALPDTLRVRDSVGYCMGSPEFNAVKLFKPGKSDFKWGEWKLNAGTVQKAQLPDLKLTGGVDTLRYKFSRSKGCYVEGKLLLRPRTTPELKLKDEAQYCLPATIVNFRTEQKLVEKISEWNDCNHLIVYEDNIASDKRRYEDSKSGPKDANRSLDKTLNGKKYIYKIENKLVDSLLMGKCRILDTVSLKVSEPKLKVLKGDTLKYPWAKFDFARLKDGFVDTADLVPSSLQWRLVPDNKPCGTGLYGGAYTLTKEDVTKDTLKFEIAAETYCGDKLKDTLYIELIHLKIHGYKDTICSNEEGYPLWNKVQWSHADLSTVRWKILWPSVAPGTLTAEIGSEVKYKPGDGTDSVRIWFEANLEDVPDERMRDTIVLKINPAPVAKFNQDTLWACDKKIILKNIKEDYLHQAFVTKIKRKDYFNAQKVAGRWSGTEGDYTFEGENLDNKDNDLFQKVIYEAVGLPGCKAVEIPVVLAQPVPAKVTFKRAYEEMCAGESLKLDTLYTLTGEDRFIQYKWLLTEDQLGRFEDGRYTATFPEDRLQELVLKTSKEYTCYNGNPSGTTLEHTSARLPLTVHRQPDFRVERKFDTLCQGVDKITIMRNWVKVTEGLYPDYQDSVRVNGIRLLNDGIRDYQLSVGEDEVQKLVVTVSQGRCTHWAEQSDTISVYRLPKMSDGNFSVGSVCGKGGTGEIDRSQLFVHELAKSQYWWADGGTLTNDNHTFVANNDVSNATVHLTVTPPHGCDPETYDAPVIVGRQPKLDKRSDIVCRVAGHTHQLLATVTNPTVKVQQIAWYRVGEPDAPFATTNATQTECPLTLTEADIQQEKLEIEARISSNGACSGEFRDTIQISWQEPPTLTIGDSPATVCQTNAEGINLAEKVQALYYNEVTWNLQNGSAGSLVEESVFKPKEDFSGTANIQVTAFGFHGCPEESKTIQVEVLPAPESGITVEGESCTRRQVELKPTTTPAQILSYDWDFGDGSQQGGTAGTVNHSYDDAKTYTVTLTANFTNGCTRVEEKEWLVNPTPQAIFDLPKELPINKLVSWTSTSLPETVSCRWSVDGRSFSTPTVNYTFTTPGKQDVILIVTATEGCTDTLPKSTEVLESPVPNFTVTLDECTGEVAITNKSTRANATPSWDFGNGSSVSHDWDPQPLTYTPIFKDTTYTIRLTLVNVSDSVDFTQKVKVISDLKPDFEIREPDPCNKTSKKIEITTRGKAEKTTVTWGDGSKKEEWTSDQLIRMLSHIYEANEGLVSKSYTITLTAENSCHKGAPITKNVSVTPAEVTTQLLRDNPDQHICYGEDVNFWNRSHGFISRGFTCEWDFGDGTPLQSDTVATTPKMHRFEKPGTYEVRLRVKDECNERVESLSVIIHGNDSLAIAFGKDKDKLCTGDSVRIWLDQKGKERFSNLSWTLPDETRRLNEDTIYYKFKNPGDNWKVLLSAEADGCKERTRTWTCKVQQTPKALIDFTEPGVESVGCTPLSMPFKAAGGIGNIRYFWDFGDGSSSIEQTPTPPKVFEREGDYKVRLSMESTNGCIGRDSLSVTAQITPVPRFTLSRRLVCSSEGDFEITMFNRTEDAENCTFEWYRGNDMVSRDKDSLHLLFEHFHGKEKIALCATHVGSHCPAWMNDSIVSSRPLKASLSVSPDTICAGMEVVFRDTLSLAGSTCEFYFDDGTLDDSKEVSKTYEEPGRYAYRFVQRNADGCTDTLRASIFVHTLPVPEFEWKETNLQPHIANLRPGIALPEKGNGGVRFINHSTLTPMEGEGAGLSYYWDFGDGQFSREKEPAHRFENNGVYDVVLYAISEQGCRDSISYLVDDISAIKGLFFPNAIVPASSDPGVNRFQPKGIGLHTFTLKVYGPDGTCVWQTDRLDDGRPAEYWDGTYNGRPVPAGVYNWEASALFIDGTVQNHINGALIVIR